MAYHRSAAGAYQRWADEVNDQSYSFNEFAPFFEKSLNFTPPDTSTRFANSTPDYDLSTLGNSTGPLQVTFPAYAESFSSYAQQALQQIGVPPINGFTSGDLLGSSYVATTIDHSTAARESSQTSFLDWALQGTSLMVYQSTFAKKIIFNKHKKATGVLCSSEGYNFTLSARKEVILSAGTFQSPQLLMVSGIGPAATLHKHGIKQIVDAPAVGQNMWDHVLAGPSYRVDLITASALSKESFLLEAEQQFIQNQTGMLTSTGGDFLAFGKLPADSLSNSTKGALSVFPADWPQIEYLAEAAYLGLQNNYISGSDVPTDDYNYATVAVALVSPLSRGTVSISSSDMATPPVIDPNWLSHPADREVLLAAYKHVRNLWQTAAMQQITIGAEYFPGPQVQTDEEIMDVIRRSSNTLWHAAGTCAMGMNSTGAVIDTKARVFGVSGLRVVDASAMPFLPPGHPQATICKSRSFE